MSYSPIDIETELMNALADEIRAEIDRDILKHLNKLSGTFHYMYADTIPLPVGEALPPYGITMAK